MSEFLTLSTRGARKAFKIAASRELLCAGPELKGLNIPQGQKLAYGRAEMTETLELSTSIPP